MALISKPPLPLPPPTPAVNVICFCSLSAYDSAPSQSENRNPDWQSELPQCQLGSPCLPLLHTFISPRASQRDGKQQGQHSWITSLGPSAHTPHPPK